MADKSYVDLTPNTKLRLTGSDRLRYLNGQVSNNVKKSGPRDAIAACVTTAKGKLNALVFITESSGKDAYLIDSAPDLRESLAMRLERYIISDDCELQDVTDEFEFIHVPGEFPDSNLNARRNDSRYAKPGYDLWLPPGSLEKLHVEGWSPFSSAEVESMRIQNGAPAWGAELTENTLPAEALLDLYAVDFHKGCYIGQEVISRIKSVGRVNRLLVRIQSQSPLAAGMILFSTDGKEVGTLTSAADSIALGMVKRDFSAPGTPLYARNIEKELSTPCEISNTPHA